MAVVRRATAGDAEALTDLYLDVRRRRLANVLSARQLERESNGKERVSLTNEWKSLVRSQSHRLFLAEQGPKPTGLLVTELDAQTGSAELMRFHTELGAQDACTDLLRHGLKDLGLRKCVAVSTWVYEADTEGRAFWERIKWRATGQQEVQNWHGEALRSHRYVSTVALALAALR